jgi:hypothetical protein
VRSLVLDGPVCEARKRHEPRERKTGIIVGRNNLSRFLMDPGLVNLKKILLNDCGRGSSNKNTIHEITRKVTKKTPIFRVCSCDFVDRSLN